MLRKVDRILLRVPQLESAVRYYRDVLGMKLVRQMKGIAAFALGESELVLHADPDQPAEGLYFLVDDVRDLYARRDELRLKFTGAPVAVARGYRATARDPFGNVLLLLDRTAGAGESATEDARAPGALFSGVAATVPAKRELLIRIYSDVGRTADDLPYTPHFEKLYSAYATHFGDAPPTRQEVWRHLLNLRKAAKLPRLGEARSPAPEVDPDARQRLRDALGEDIGRRDRLPYTERFEKLVDEFNASLPRRLSPHQAWRLVATLAK